MILTHAAIIMAKIFIELAAEYPYPVYAAKAGGCYRMGGKLGDSVNFEVYFMESGVLVDPPTATFILELKGRGQYEGAAMVRVTEFTAATDGDGQDYLEIAPEWNSESVLAILEPGGERQPRKLHAMAEFSWQDGAGNVASTASFEAVIKNDIVKEFTSPAVPLPDAPWPSSNVDVYDGPAVAGFGGGSLNDVIEHLDSSKATQADVDALKLLDYQGTWNADADTPAIPAAAAANKNHYYIVSTAGNTDIDGETGWEPGDWIISNGTAWSKVDNSDQDLSGLQTKALTVADNDAKLALTGLAVDTEVIVENEDRRRERYLGGGESDEANWRVSEAPEATDTEITTGTETEPRQVSPAQLKLAAETHRPWK